MAKIYSVILLCFCMSASAQVITFADLNLKAKLLTSSTQNDVALDSAMNKIKIDTNNDGEIQLSEALNVSYLHMLVADITDLSGIENFTNLHTLDVRANHITSFDATIMANLKRLELNTNDLLDVNVAGMSQLEWLDVANNELGVINLTGLDNLKYLGVYGNPISSVAVTPLAKLEFIEGGGASSNVSSVDVSGLAHLNTLYWFDNSLESVNITGCVALEVIDIEDTMIGGLDITNCPLLRTLRVARNQLTALDVSQNPLLEEIDCDNNLIPSLTFHSNSPYCNVFCGFNGPMTELNLSGTFGFIYCNDTQVATLDLSQATFYELEAHNGMLEQLYIKNGQNNIGNVQIQDNPLIYICADEEEVAYFQAHGGLAYHVNSYCSFEPGGTVYDVNGHAVVDLNTNGCDVEDVGYPNLRYAIASGSNSGTHISDNSGNYEIAVNAGIYSLTPLLEYPDYFTVSPEALSINFPDDGTAVTQNFCITPNGNHNDLEILILPVGRPLPGFDIDYKVVLKNNGTATWSGNVTLAFQDGVLDVVSSFPAAANALDNLLTWSYADLAPFESRSIDLVLNLNSPSETPAVAIGNELDFTAVIYPLDGDETPGDNTFFLKQIVVGSIDPNDKTCLEGNNVGPEIIGDYVHYMIRFENTGTYAAENVVVEDWIDPTKFDISSLVPLAASHFFVTRISGSKVEFIFENINLPFDEGSNDGYINFKIKTLPTLEVGSAFANQASIYFDYNFPVATNNAVTGIEVLGSPGFNFPGRILIYPNPASTVLHIQPADGIHVQSIRILNTLGQEVVQTTTDVNAVDVSMLQTGVYLIEIENDQGHSVSRFIKK